ncbi:unnamed protein product [Orchesella dallaii]|uniref:Protein kinase domain-containing protein n=1 Tax=Orchesella dallaii TaxID=48710 RepID=A0ABP1RHM2_9HEXA
MICTSRTVQVLWMFFSVTDITKSEIIHSIRLDQNFSGITFHPHISHINHDPNAYSESDIEAMLKVISRRFFHVIVRPDIEAPSNDSSTIQSNTYIQRIAAKLNKKSQISQINSFKFKLMLTIDVDNDANLRTVLKNVDYALLLAAEANLIHPGTVSALLLNVDDIEKNTSNNISIQVMSYIRNQKQALNQDLQVGIWIVTEDCGSSYIPKYTLLVLQHADFVIFYNVPTTIQVGFGAQIASQSIIFQFSICEKRLRRSFPSNLQIMWSTFSSSLESEGYGHNFFITYWKLMSDWAARNKQLLYFMEAFDTPLINYPRISSSHRGWWRLKRADIIDITENSFVEKINVSRSGSDGSKPKNKEENVDSLSITTIVLIALAIGLVLFLLLGVAMFMLYRNVKNLQTQRLNKEDYEEFMNGNTDSGGPGAEAGGNCLEMLRLPYDKKQYELDKTSFTIDYKSLLGTGTFGSVYKGTIHDTNKECAFKLTQPSCSITTLKGLLSEIKLLSYLGNHENIVALIGSYTAELRNGIVYVVIELCNGGSLEKFLRAQERNYTNVASESTRKLNDGGKILYKRFNWEHDMLRWCVEISSGLEYIASKNVVHADIAARNILLTSNLTAKISDFGLSRRMYDYTNYVKKQQEPLPWRWMSIEALRSLEFSEKSDVWAFGVTMWEIFSVGDTPYPGLSWNLDFVGELQKGLRLQRPQYSTEEIYLLMLECWNPNPTNRCSFKELKSTLTNLDAGFDRT